MAYGELVLEIENYVSPTNKHFPLTGVYGVDDGTDGWQWDRRLLPSTLQDQTRYLTYVGGHEKGLLDGTKIDDWQSGVFNGLEYHGMSEFRIRDATTWTPVYKTGSFSVYWDRRPLYSDWSFQTIVDPSADVDGHHEMSLRDDAVHNSVTATVYKRLNTFEIVAIREATLVQSFTGSLSGGARLSTGDADNIVWSNVDDRKKEMLINSSNQLIFNGDLSIQVGIDTSVSSEIEESWENKNAGLQSGRTLFGEYFPIARGSVELVSINSSGVVTSWTEVQSLNTSGPADQHFSVNYDMGTVETGGYQAPDLVLEFAVQDFDIEINVIPDDNIESYPDQGIIIIGSEQIYYANKTATAFIDCVRGWNSTTATAHAKGSIVSDIQHGAATTDTWYLRYKAIPRVEYEVTEHDLRTANYSSWLDVRASANVKANNIVQLVSQDDNLAEIVLTTDAERIGGNLYGPVFYGTDTRRLTATAYDAAGNPVEDIDLTIYIKSGAGALNGSLSEFTAPSNSLGQTNCFYNAPYTSEEIDFEVTKVEHVGSDTQMTVNFTTAVLPEDIWVYQILKHDPVLGTAGDAVTVFDGDIASEPFGLGYIDAYMAFVEDYNGGTILFEDASGVRRTATIRWAEQRTAAGTDEPFVRLYLESEIKPAWIVASQKAWLFQKDATEWNSAFKRGARVIVYEWSEVAVHPITGEVGAYYPLKPDSISGNVLTFNGRNLPVPDPDDRENNLGGYVVVAPSEARFSAYGRDPFTGRLVTSNDIRFQLRLPNTLTGVDSSGVLPIPYGWTLITEEFNIGAGLDGANFITINPAASGINQFNITGVIS